MILSAHQPAHLPWLGYLDKIARSDLFVFLDHVQFEKNSFTNRNRIRTPQGTAWLTVPLSTRGHMNGAIRDLRIDESRPWRERQIRTIAMAYRRAPAFDAVFPVIEGWISDPTDRFADYCFHQLQGWLRQAEIGTEVVRSSDLAPTARKSDLVLELCRRTGADRYLSGALGRNYLDEASFAAAGIAVEYQDFRAPIHPQLWGEFVPNLSAVDHWMNTGDLRTGFAAA